MAMWEANWRTQPLGMTTGPCALATGISSQRPVALGARRFHFI